MSAACVFLLWALERVWAAALILAFAACGAASRRYIAEGNGVVSAAERR